MTDAETAVRACCELTILMLRKSELCELLGQRTGKWVSRTALCRYLQKLGLNNRKKKHGTVAKPEQKEYKN